MTLDPPGWQRQLALVLSVVLSPFVCVPVFCTLYAHAVARSPEEFRLLAAVCVACSVGVPFVYIAWNVWRGRITDIHVSRLDQRRGPFAAGLLGMGLLSAVLYSLSAPTQLTRLALVIFCEGWVFDAISRSWKISLHTGVLAMCLAGSMNIMGWSPWCLLLLPPLAWARHARGRHLLSQGWAGAAVGFLLTYLPLRLLG